ncbi:hypothetical protein S40293_11552 [Stachybotrys chartarum IBT 40293]|nr:hypothetical protein S40293_11552 [Stachybotrys chartarum IBT 40293]
MASDEAEHEYQKIKGALRGLKTGEEIMLHLTALLCYGMVLDSSDEILWDDHSFTLCDFFQHLDGHEPRSRRAMWEQMAQSARRVGNLDLNTCRWLNTVIDTQLPSQQSDWLSNIWWKYRLGGETHECACEKTRREVEEGRNALVAYEKKKLGPEWMASSGLRGFTDSSSGCNHTPSFGAKVLLVEETRADGDGFDSPQLPKSESNLRQLLPNFQKPSITELEMVAPPVLSYGYYPGIPQASARIPRHQLSVDTVFKFGIAVNKLSALTDTFKALHHDLKFQQYPMEPPTEQDVLDLDQAVVTIRDVCHHFYPVQWKRPKTPQTKRHKDSQKGPGGEVCARLGCRTRRPHSVPPMNLLLTAKRDMSSPGAVSLQAPNLALPKVPLELSTRLQLHLGPSFSMELSDLKHSTDGLLIEDQNHLLRARMIKLSDSLRVLQEKIPNWRETLLATNIPQKTIKQINYDAQQQNNLNDIFTYAATVYYQLKTYLQVKGNAPTSQEKGTPLELALHEIHSLSQQAATQLLRDGCSENIMELHSTLGRIGDLVKTELDTTLLDFELQSRHGLCSQVGKSLSPSTPAMDLTSITQVSALYYYECAVDYSDIIRLARSSQRYLSEYVRGMLDTVAIRKDLTFQLSSDLPNRIETMRSVFNSEKGAIGFVSLQDQGYPQQNPRQIILHYLGDLPVKYAVTTICFDELDEESFLIVMALIFGRLCGALCLWPHSISQMGDIALQLGNLVQIAISVDEDEETAENDEEMDETSDYCSS